MSIEGLRRRFRAARGGRPRRIVVELADGVPGGALVDEDGIRQLETRQAEIPQDGRRVLTLAAALHLDPFEVLADVGYWPPLPSSHADAAAHRYNLVRALVRQLGGSCSRNGGRMVVEL